MKNNRKTFSGIRGVVAFAALASALALAGCASDEAAAPAAPEDAAPPAAAEASPPASPPASASSAFGAPAPRFAIPSAANQGPPSVNTVPTDAPTPASTEAEREEARRGLVADLANARHSEQGGRTQPVVVRPYVETAASDAPAPPTAAETPPDAPITNRLDAPPPPRPPEAGGVPAKPPAGPAPANRIPTGSE